MSNTKSTDQAPAQAGLRFGITPLELAEAKAKFDATKKIWSVRQKIHAWNATQWLDALEDKEKSFEDIADELRITRERVRQVHRDFFPFVRSEEDRRSHKGLHNKRAAVLQQAKKEEELLSRRFYLRVIVACAKAMGFEVKAVRGVQSFSTKHLLINGQLCTLALVRKPQHAGTNYPYALVRISRKGLSESAAAFILVFVDTIVEGSVYKRIYLIPAPLFLESELVSIILPFGRKRNYKKKIDWQSYADEQGFEQLRAPI